MAYLRKRLAADGGRRYECCGRDPVTNRERSKTFRHRSDAEQHAKLVEADLVRGVSAPAPADGSRRVGDVVERWLTLHSPTLKVKTAATYAGLVRSRILPPLGSVRLVGYQGLRFGELAGLRRRNVDLRHKRRSVTDTLVELGGRLIPDTPKSHQARVTPLVEHLVEPLRQHLDGVQADPDTYLFQGDRGGLLRYTHWRHTVWLPACAKTGIVGVSPHALRHSIGKMLANAGVPTVGVKLIMGHASASFTMETYGHASEDDLTAAADAVADYRRHTLRRRPIANLGRVRATTSKGLSRRYLRTNSDLAPQCHERYRPALSGCLDRPHTARSRTGDRGHVPCSPPRGYRSLGAPETRASVVRPSPHGVGHSARHIDVVVVGSAHERDQRLWREDVGDRTLRLTNGGGVVMKLFRRRSKKGEPDTGSAVPVSGAPPVDGPEGSPTAETAQPVSVNGGPVQPAPSWSYPLPVIFAPPWPIEEMIRVEEYLQDGTLVVRAELPGIDPDKDVHLSVVNGRLAIEAERHEEAEVDRDGFMLRELRYGRFSRTLPLAAGVTAASITATYKDGLLEVRIPAAAATPAPPPARIPIATS